MKVAYVRPAKARGYFIIGVTDMDIKAAYTVAQKDFDACGGIFVNDELDDKTLSVISESDEHYRAKLCALRILAYADNNRKNLVNKLLNKGISYTVAKAVTEEMVNVGYIDEERQLERLVLREANVNLSGPNKIRAKFVARGFSAADVDGAIEKLEAEGQIDFELSKNALLKKKVGEDADNETKKKILYKNGYSVC